MNAKIFVTTALLSFVALSIGTIVVREGSGERNVVATNSAEVSTKSSTTDGVDVYYFHGDTRCPTCRRIEALAQAAIESSFGDEMAAGQVAWHVVNYDLAENEHFLTDYELIAPTVVVVGRKGAQQIAWQNLSRVWELVGDQDAFSKYVCDAVNTHLKDVVTR